ncbi:hypothetical protein ABVT39_005625 [Epinephelus coioides]
MAKRALDASKNAAANEKETPGRGGKMMYDDERNVICSTTVTSFRELWPAPQKRGRHIGRMQMPPASALTQEWSLNAGGAWGYKFNYKANEVCFYQLEKGESFGSLVAQATLTSIDWSVLNMVELTDLRAPETRDTRKANSSHSLKESLPGTQKKKIVASTVWETKSSASGRWFYRASRQVSLKDKHPDEFVLEYFSSKCGEFQASLCIPLTDWLEMMEENAENIKELFASSRSSRDIMLVRYTTPS